MSNTALIIRPADSPQIHVLEVDGLRRRYVQRGEGSYYLSTNNHPSCDELELLASDGRRGCLKAWDQHYWEIYQKNDGSVEVHACRPTLQETIRGDLHGRWSSTITLGTVGRWPLRSALRIARMLATCNPIHGIQLAEPFEVRGIAKIETEIPVIFAWED